LKISAVKGQLYLGAWMDLRLYFTHCYQLCSGLVWRICT